MVVSFQTFGNLIRIEGNDSQYKNFRLKSEVFNQNFFGPVYERIAREIFRIYLFLKSMASSSS